MIEWVREYDWMCLCVALWWCNKLNNITCVLVLMVIVVVLVVVVLFPFTNRREKKNCNNFVRSAHAKSFSPVLSARQSGASIDKINMYQPYGRSFHSHDHVSFSVSRFLWMYACVCFFCFFGRVWRFGFVVQRMSKKRCYLHHFDR